VDSQALNLKSVDAKYHKIAKQVVQRPKKFAGKFVQLHDLPGDENQPIPNCLEINSLSDLHLNDLADGLRIYRSKNEGLLYAVAYERISTAKEQQAASLRGQFVKLLSKCASLDVTLIGICIDVDGGDKANRSGLAEAMAMIHRGWAHCIIVPTISRLDRDETTFSGRMKELDSCESWIYYGESYRDMNSLPCVWRMFGTRGNAVDAVRAAERYLMDGRMGVQAATFQKLEEGLLVQPAKVANFCLYDVVVEDIHVPGSRRRLVKRPDAELDFRGIVRDVMFARKNRDGKVFDKIAKRFHLKHDNGVTGSDVKYELLSGWAWGQNCNSPYASNVIWVDCPWRSLEDDDEVVSDFIDALYELVNLEGYHSSSEATIDDADPVLKQKLRELMPADTKIGLRLTCNCLPELTPVQRVGKGNMLDGISQDFVFCPSCGDSSSGNPTKIRWPHKKAVDAAQALPMDPCVDCGQYKSLVQSHVQSTGKLWWQIFGCRDCRTVNASRSQTKLFETNENAAKLRPPRPSRKEHGCSNGWFL
jgi:hypothetical protein